MEEAKEDSRIGRNNGSWPSNFSEAEAGDVNPAVEDVGHDCV